MSSVAERSLAALFEATAARRPGRSVGWLEDLRLEGQASFRDAGLPTPRHEDWRFTSLEPLAGLELAAAGAAPAPGGAIDAARDWIGSAAAAVFVNGRLHAGASDLDDLPPGVRVASLHRTLADEPERVEGILGSCCELKTRPLAALNTALFEDGALVEIDANASCELPVHLVFAHVGDDTPTVVHPRVLVHAREGSRACVIEHHVGVPGTTGLANALTELRLDAGADLDHVVVQDAATSCTWIGSLAARQERDSRLRTTSLARGAALGRLEIEARLEGEGAHVEMNGLYLAGGSRLLDHHTTIDHAVPRTTSDELYKGILDDRGRGVFHGRIHVRPDAQQIAATQTNRALLLSDGARVNTKPQLEIHADDVKCSHGASIGQLDPDHLFYLRSRGLDAAAARALLTFAFASEIARRLPFEALSSGLRERVMAWLAGEESS